MRNGKINNNDQGRGIPSDHAAMAKYSFIAYLLWLFLGCFGIHHFYLGRDKHGFLLATTFGGFGLGWFRDLVRIPDYVCDANEDQRYLAELGAYMRRYRFPSYTLYRNSYRVIAGVFVAMFYRWLFLSAIPKGNPPLIHDTLTPPSLSAFFLGPLGTAFGVWLVSNVGRVKSRAAYSLVGAYAGELVFCTPGVLTDSNSTFLASLCAMALAVVGWRHKRLHDRWGLCQRATVWGVLGVLFLGMWTSHLYFNAEVTVDDGETIKLHDAVSHFFKSPAWREMKKSGWKVWSRYWEEGWEGAHRTFHKLADVDGEAYALDVMELDGSASWSEIRERYHHLAKEWHPDHHQSKQEEERDRAKDRFLEIKEAYEILKRIRS